MEILPGQGKCAIESAIETFPSRLFKMDNSLSHPLLKVPKYNFFKFSAGNKKEKEINQVKKQTSKSTDQ